MKSRKLVVLTSAVSAAGAFVVPDCASAQAIAQSGQTAHPTPGNPDNGAVQDIIVTAQKRSETANSVGMSITAVTGDALAQRGVVDTADLVKVVPGFNFTQSAYNTPVYTLRGVGLYESGLGVSPAVSVYLDEVPLPYPVMTESVGLDMERVEVLKGPQGTLFGENSTGGAINYIAAKPTNSFKAGADISYERFGKVDASGFVSGPLTDTLTARLALRVISGGAWQESLTRPDDKLGDQRKFQGRLLLDWQATDKLKFSLNINGWRDNSDTIAGQLAIIRPAIPANANPGLLDGSIKLSPDDPRSAEWSPDYPNRQFNHFFQASLRTDYSLSDAVTLTSLTSYDNQHVNMFLDRDATVIDLVHTQSLGDIHSFNQELRLTGNTGKIKWITGANYSHDTVDEQLIFIADQLSVSPPGRISTVDSYVNQKITNYALFANGDYDVSGHLIFHAGARYTNSRRSADACMFETSRDAPNYPYGSLINAIQQGLIAGGLKTTPFVPVQPGDCLTLSPAPDYSPGVDHPHLHEDNLSWRFGLDYKLDGGGLLYANYSRGWKSGIISNSPGIQQSQYDPVRQERVDAYEVGFKIPALRHHIQLNGAAFYYDYKDKQIRGHYIDPVVGLVENLATVPKSRIWGVEGEVVARPFRGLDLHGSATYLNSEIADHYIAINGDGLTGDFKGSPLPYTPQFTALGDAQYSWAVGRYELFLGGSVTYSGKDTTTYYNQALPSLYFRLPKYALIDLRAGFSDPNGRWQLTFYGRNITNKFYYTTIYSSTDVFYRYAGRPAVYGMRFSMKFD